MARRWTMGSRATSWALVGILELPLVGLWMATQFWGPSRLWLTGDFAIADHNARLAAQGGMYVGVYDRFGWHHPGPALSYLQAAAMHLFGSDQRTLFAVSILVLIGSILGAAALLITQCSVVSARLGLLGLAGLGVWMGSTTVGWASDTQGSLLMSPWNPDVVIAPCLVLLLLAPLARSHPWALVGVVLLGSALIQTDIGTTPLVVSVLFVSIVLLVAAVRRDPEVRARWGWTHSHRAVLGGLAGMVVLWSLPLAQQVSSAPHNLSAILGFFLHPGVEAHHGTLGISVYWYDAILHYVTERGTWVTAHHLLDLLGVLLMIAVLTVAWIRSQPGSYLRGLVPVVGAGVIASLVAINAIVGPAIGYLMGWSLAVFFAMVITILIVLGEAIETHDASARAATWGASAIALCAAVILSVQILGGLGVSSYQDPAVKEATAKVRATIAAGSPTIELRYDAPIVLDPYYVGIYFGVFNELERAGIKVVLPPEASTHFGNGPYAMSKGTPTPIGARRTLHLDPTTAHATPEDPTRRPKMWVTSESVPPGTSVPAP